MSSEELKSLSNLEALVIQTIEHAYNTLSELSKDTNINQDRILTETKCFINTVKIVHERFVSLWVLVFIVTTKTTARIHSPRTLS